MKRPMLISALSMDNDGGSIAPLSSKRRRLNYSFNWKVGELPEMPYLYAREKTSVIVLNDSPQKVADRIVSSAKAMNCIGEFDDSKAKATLSVDGTEFCVQLFQVEVTTDTKKDCIVVELQRLNGSTIVFHTVASSIIAASKNMERRSSSSKRLTVNEREDNETKDDDLFSRSLEIVDTLLKKDRVDANLLGMESLQFLTNPKSSSDDMVHYTSNILLNGGEFMDVREKLFSLIVDNIPCDNEVEEKYHQKMRVCALVTLSNVLDAEPGNDSDNFGEDEWAGDDGLIATLLNEMKSAKSKPFEAYLAAKSLLTIFKNSTRMRAVALDLGISSASLQNEIESHEYPLLKNVSSVLLQVLGESK